MGSTETGFKKFDASRLRVGLVVSRYNPSVCEGLMAGARRGLESMGLPEKQLKVLRVPGAFELPLAGKLLAESGQFDAVICLGAVIRGDTSHFDYVCEGVTHGLQEAMLETGIPMAFGVLTTDNEEQAKTRCRNDDHNKGLEAAYCAVEMALLRRDLKNQG